MKKMSCLKNRKFFSVIILLTGLSFLLAACSDDDFTNPTLQSGFFMDSAVAQLFYKTDTLQGTTDKDGMFYYKSNESVSFYIGGEDGLFLGQTKAKQYITPGDLTQDTNRLTNMVRLLQALDINNDPTDGIYFSTSKVDLIYPALIDLNQAKESFSVGGLTLPSETDAMAHYNDTLSVLRGDQAKLALTIAANPLESVLPFPNDILWSLTGGKVYLDPNSATDPSFEALYSAINALGISGLSPNLTIWVPLVSSMQLDSDTLADYIKVYQIGTALAQVTGFKIFQDYNMLKIVPLAPLDPGKQYLVVIEKGVLDNNGNELQEPDLFEYVKSEDPLTGAVAALEPIRQNYAMLFSVLSAQFNLSKENILEMFTFTTADKTLSLADLGVVGQAAAGAVNLTDIPSMITGLNYADTNNNTLPDIVEEYEAIGSAVDSAAALSTVSQTSFTSFDITTLASTPSSIDVTYSVFNPAAFTNTVAIFQHGFTVNKSSARLLTIDFPVFAMDLPEHGDRRSSACTGTEDGACFLTTNVGQDRINLYQSYFDMSLMLRLLANGNIDIDGDGAADLPAHIYFGGQSMGAITGSVFAAHNSAMLEKIVLDVGGANLTTVLDNAANMEIIGLMSSLNLKPNSIEYFTLLGLFQTLLDPADPIYLANATFIGKPIYKDKTIVQTAYMDTVVPNISNQVLAATVGYYASGRTDFTDFTTFNASENVTPGWYQFGGKAGKSDNWINHGFLLNYLISGYTEAIGRLDAEYVLQAHYAALSQYNAFYKQ